MDVLCIGHASYDLVFSVAHHPAADEKTTAENLLSCGGGPAANAAVQVAKLGLSAGFCGYLGQDVYGDSHLHELQALGVNTELVVRGHHPTPLSAVLVKPDGKRALVNYKGKTTALAADSVSFTNIQPKIILFDGHEPHLSLALQKTQGYAAIPSILDGGSLHEGTLALMDKVEYLVCSKKFAVQYAGHANEALSRLSALNPVVVITLGERGLIWKRGLESGELVAPDVMAIDSTGAGDAFHGAFAAGLAANLPWQELLRFASAAGALCCTQIGARPGLADRLQIEALLDTW